MTALCWIAVISVLAALAVYNANSWSDPIAMWTRATWSNTGDPSRAFGEAGAYMKLKGDKRPRVVAGCRDFSMAEARKHWNETRKGTPLGDETTAILDCLEAMARARGLIKKES